MHISTYYDYSHGIRLVKNIMIIDGEDIYRKLLKDPDLCKILSDESIIKKKI